MTPLRQLMIRELELHRKSPATIKQYVGAVAQLARHYGRSPEALSLEEVRSLLHHLIVERKLAFSSCNQKLAGINRGVKLSRRTTHQVFYAHVTKTRNHER